jgi:hypothetical protein
MPGSIHVGFVVDKVALGRFFSEFFGFPLSVSFHRHSPYSCIIWRKYNMLAKAGINAWVLVDPPYLQGGKKSAAFTEKEFSSN